MGADYAIVAGGPVGGLLETCCWMRGYDQFPIDLILNKEMAHTLYGFLMEDIFYVQLIAFKMMYHLKM